jgi:hypothetical protein
MRRGKEARAALSDVAAQGGEVHRPEVRNRKGHVVLPRYLIDDQ